MTLKLDLSEDTGEFRTPSDINVTPLVDVMLVLLVIFMITAPMLATGMKVTLPSSSSATPLEGVAPVIISIGDDSTIWVGLEVVRREDMINVVERQVSGDKSRVLQLRGHTMARYGDVVFIMGELAKNGFNRIVVETDPKKGE